MGMQAGDVRQIKQEIQNAFANLLLLLAIVPMGALVVASLGVTNTIMASVRSAAMAAGRAAQHRLHAVTIVAAGD